jgi:class 3 adenylate cyclase/tetratricopeptide (TPR) repeat protein
MARCAACGSAQPDAARFCGQCGAALVRACAGCGATLQPGQRFCTACGLAAGTSLPAPAEATARDAADAEAGERRPATIVFSDLSGYTALNERIDPEEVAQLLAELRAIATAVVEAQGGLVNQFVGDEIMALFGIPHAGRADPVRALRAALALHAAMRDFGRRHEARAGVVLQLHTGINSGLVVVRPCAPHQGKVGVTGDAVNTAARLLQLAGPDEIVIGDDTWRQVSAHFDAERMPPVEVRGKARPVQPWRLLREVEARAAAPLVARDDELRQAQSALQTALGGAGARWVVIRGEPGIGKSRLLQALGQAAADRGAAVVATAVPDFGPARGAVAWRGLLAALLGLPASADAPARADALQQAVDAGLLAPGQRAHACALLELPIPPDAQADLAALDAAGRERGALQVVVTLWRARAAGGGLLVAVEDVHWAEAPSLALLARAAAACHELPLLLALTTRPPGDNFDAQRRAHAPRLPALTLDLAPLDDAAAHRLAGHLAAAAPELVERCIARAGGNPLFLEQLLRAAGDAVRDALPNSVQALVLARLDRLAPQDKAALQAASVLGQRVDLPVWAALVDGPRLEPLVEAGLLRPDDGAALFVHALIRDGAYASLLKARRRELHQRAAGWYDGRDAGLRAEHLALAESPQAAAAFAAAARGELQRMRYAEALALAGRGAALAVEAADRHALGLLQGEALRELGRNADALAAFEQARDAAADAADVARAWTEIAGVQRFLAQVAPALHALDQAQPVAEQLGDGRWRARIHYLRGNLHFARGEIGACAAEHGAALALAERAGDEAVAAQALSGLGDAHYAAGRLHSALGAFERCIAACERVDARRFAVMNRAMLGWCLFWHGRHDESQRQLQAAREAAVAMAHRNAEAMVVESLGVMLAWANDPEAAVVLERAVALAHEAGMRRFELISLVALAGARRREGARAEGLRLAREAWRLCTEVGGEAFGGALVLAEVGCCSDDVAEAEALLGQAERQLAAGALSHNHLVVHVELMRLRLAQRRHDDALRHARALEHYVRDEPVFWATHHARVGRALVRAAQGEADAALAAELAALIAEARSGGLAHDRPALQAALAALQ